MKLWQVIQWGNPEDGGDGWDTQCVISATSLEEAVDAAKHIFLHASIEWKQGKADAVYLLGEDSNSDGKPKLIIPKWISSAFNLGHNPAWFRDTSSDIWLDEKTMYGL